MVYQNTNKTIWDLIKGDKFCIFKTSLFISCNAVKHFPSYFLYIEYLAWVDPQLGQEFFPKVYIDKDPFCFKWYYIYTPLHHCGYFFGRNMWAIPRTERIPENINYYKDDIFKIYKVVCLIVANGCRCLNRGLLLIFLVLMVNFWLLQNFWMEIGTFALASWNLIL